METNQIPTNVADSSQYQALLHAFSRFRFIARSTVLLLLMLAGSQAYANQIISCTTAAATPGAFMQECTFGDNGVDTGFLDIAKTFGVETPAGSLGGLNVGLGLTNDIAGNNTTGVILYTVTETITNDSDIDWTDFHITSPNASSIDVLSFSGFDGCDSTITCAGGIVSGNGGSFTITYTLGTPTDQNSGAFALFETPSVSVPEPATLALLGIGLAGLGAMRRRKV